jgi:hypothetical protein
MMVWLGGRQGRVLPGALHMPGLMSIVQWHRQGWGWGVEHALQGHVTVCQAGCNVYTVQHA